VESGLLTLLVLLRDFRLIKSYACILNVTVFSNRLPGTLRHLCRYRPHALNSKILYSKYGAFWIFKWDVTSQRRWKYPWRRLSCVIVVWTLCLRLTHLSNGDSHGARRISIHDTRTPHIIYTMHWRSCITFR